jgi:anti-sigma factor RsiW
MIDHWTEEKLSRYLDDDLDGREAEELEARLASDAELRAELDALRRVRDSVASLADRMEPPNELDILVTPLQREMPRRGPAPVLRWVGIAAALALGVTVALEVARKNPGPSEEIVAPAPARIATPAPTEIVPSAASPKSETVPPGRRPRTDDRQPSSSLAASEVEESEATKVVGTLVEKDEADSLDREPRPDAKKRSAAAGKGRDAEGRIERFDAAAGMPAQAPSDANLRAPKGQYRAAGEQRFLELRASTGEVVSRLPLVAPDAEVGAEYAVIITGGAISEARALDGGVANETVEALVGIPVPEVADGGYRARVIDSPTSD